MKKSLLFLALSVFSFVSLCAQQKFESGYYIDTSGKRTEALIRTAGFETLNEKNAVVEVKTTETSEPQKVSASTIIETGIIGDTKLQKFEVLLDDDNYFRDDNADKYARLNMQVVFLNVLVEGPVSMYVYDSGNGPKYFYRLRSRPEMAPQQLIYKRYFDRSNIKENTEFRQQLFNDMKCDGDIFAKFADTKYNKNALLRLAEDYNQCHGGDAAVFENRKKRKHKTSFSVLAGVHMISGHAGGINPEPDSGSEVGFVVGGEVQIVMPTEDWAVFFRADVENFKANLESQKRNSEFTDDILIYNVESKTVALNLVAGGRYFFGADKANRFFVDGGLGLSVQSGTTKYIEYLDTMENVVAIRVNEQKNDATIYVTAAVGYSFSDRLALELRLDSPKKVVDDSYDFSYFKYGVNLKYSF